MNARSPIQAGRLAGRLGRRHFHATRPQLGGHYPEGPRTSIPFDPLKKGFAFKFWGYCFTGFSLPFIIAVWQTYKNH